MCDVTIHHSPSRNVSCSPFLISLIGTKKPCVMSLLYNQEGDSWLVISFQGNAGLLNGSHLFPDHLSELPFTDPITVKNDPPRLELTIVVVILLDEAMDQPLELIYVQDLLSVPENQVEGPVLAGLQIHAGYHSSDRWFVVSRSRVGDIGTHDNHRLPKHCRSYSPFNDGVDTSKFTIDLEAEVGH